MDAGKGREECLGQGGEGEKMILEPQKIMGERQKILYGIAVVPDEIILHKYKELHLVHYSVAFPRSAIAAIPRNQSFCDRMWKSARNTKTNCVI